MKSESEVAQSGPTLSDLIDCSLPGSSSHEIFQARVLEWVTIAFSVMSSNPGLLLEDFCFFIYFYFLFFYFLVFYFLNFKIFNSYMRSQT